ncbi:MAG TPA: hypothetical protein VK134_06450 [Ktedonobacteraceae bacterium]|nr:hypothetical protein [Ktedonobacteraceae bacterium]
MIEEHEILAMPLPGDIETVYLPETTISSGTADATQASSNGYINRAALARQRTSTAELLKAHTGLMEHEIILSQQSELFRLVNRHYSPCRAGKTSIPAGVSSAAQR